MRVAVLGSGSSGNSTFVQGGNTRVLVDAGFSAKAVADRLKLLEVDPESITAIVVTHEHADHTNGIGVFARRHGTPHGVSSLLASWRVSGLAPPSQ